MKHVRIFDTTLRDGEQSPGFAMKKEEKVAFAARLEALGVDVIEAGFPIASPQDFESVFAIAESCRKVEICALARCNEKDIDCAIQALEKAAYPRIHVFIATSEIHMQHKLKMTREEVKERAIRGVRRARTFTPRVEFSPEDGSRSDRRFLVEVLEGVIAAGADVINIPDTVGYMTTREYGDLIQFLMEHVKGIENVIVSTHCHDDLGLAVANSLAGVLNGARQVECTVSGIGERAGNAALEEIVMGIKTRSDIYRSKTSVITNRLLGTCQFLGEITGYKVAPNKAIVGKNAFAHGSGIHQHGMLSKAETYEVMDPKDVGFQETEIVLTKHSGKHALKHRLERLGIAVGNRNMEELFSSFKSLADKKKCVYDDDLMMLVVDEPKEQHFELISAQIQSKFGGGATAEISMRIGDRIVDRSEQAEGPVAAMYKTIQAICPINGSLNDFSLHSFTPGDSAVGVVTIQWDEEGRRWQGTGRDVDIVMAAAKALVDLLNRRHTIQNKEEL